jgi:hypothetical protein
MELPKMHPSEFCRKWVPRFRDYQEGEKGFQWECGKLIEALTGYKRTGIYGWLSGRSPAPIQVQRFLGIIDLLLEADESVLPEFCRSLQKIAMNTNSDNDDE